MLIRRQDFIQLLLAGATVGCLFLTLWLGSKAVLGFLAFGLLFFALHIHGALLSCHRNILLFLFPAWAGVTVLWAEYPMLALRLDIQLFVTFFIFISITCLAPIGRILELLCAFFALTLLSVLVSPETVEIYQTGETVRVGVLGSKNNVSIIGASALAAGAMLLASPQHSRLARCLALAAIAAAIASILQARSLGTFLSVLLCGGLGVLIWNMKVLIRSVGLRSMMVYGGLATAAALGLALVLFFSYEGYVSVMQSLGKDPTITGRTFIWSIGLRIIEENFWGGLGLNSFWSERNPDAVLIWISGSREIGAAYGFHNLYIHTWVETGLPGVLIMSAIILKMLARVVRLAKSGCSAQEASAAAFALFLVVKSFFEVPIFDVFSINTFFFFLIWVVLNKENIPQIRSLMPPQCAR